jgi:hypothetical protein
MSTIFRSSRLMKLVVAFAGTALFWPRSGAAATPATAPSPPTTAPAAPPAPAPPAIAPPAAGVHNNLRMRVGNPMIGANVARMNKQNLEALKRNIDNMPVDSTVNIDQLLHIDLQSDGLLKADLAAMAPAPEQKRIKVQGLGDSLAAKADWVIYVPPINPAMRQGTFLNLTRYDFDQDGEDQIWSTQYSFNDGIISIFAIGVGMRINFTQSNNTVNLNIFPMGGRGIQRVQQFTAANLLDLRTEHPEEVRKYLTPLLTRLAGKDLLRPGATDVYGVFTEIPAPTQAVQNVMALLPRLDADAAADRDAASADLAKLGTPGILAVQRLDRSTLTQQQKSRCDAFLNRERRRSFDNPNEALHDQEFLLEALNDDDPAVRADAHKALETLLGHSVQFDVAQTSTQRQTAVEKLREQIQKESAPAPTTGPAAVPTAPIPQPR